MSCKKTLANSSVSLWSLNTKYIRIYGVPQCLSPRPNWDPLSRKRECSPPLTPQPEPKGEAHTRLRVKGWGAPIRTTGEKA